MESGPRISRRHALGAAGALGAGALVAQLGGPGGLLRQLGLDEDAGALVASCVLTPEKTEGPYFVDEKLLRSDIRGDPSTGAVESGVPLTLRLVVVRSDGDCAPVAGAAVDVWHANASGLYSDVQNMGAGGSQAGREYLRGYQVTDADGAVAFTTIYPGWYAGRAIHVHFKVRLYDGTAATYEFTSQMFFDPAVTAQVVQASAYAGRGAPDTSNATDNIYGSDGEKLLVPLTGDVASGLSGTFVIGLDGLPSTTSTGAPGSSADGTGSSGSGSANSVLASLASARWRRSADGHRILRLVVRAEERVGVRVRLTRSGRTLASRSTALGRSRTINVTIPASRAAGRATLAIVFTDADGATTSVVRRVTVPRRRPA